MNPFDYPKTCYHKQSTESHHDGGFCCIVKNYLDSQTGIPYRYSAVVYFFSYSIKYIKAFTFNFVR